MKLTMPRTLKDFMGVHAGETAWIFGKGPSLDAFDMAQAGPLRCAINDVVRYVPGCIYGFANDSVAAWKDVYAAGQVLFQPLRLEHDMHAARCEVDAERVWFADGYEPERMAWTREQLADRGLAVRRGTLGSAEQILHVMGVKKIVCVGIDGGGRHAAKEWRTELRHDHAADYNGIRDAFITAAHLHGIEVEFFGAATNDSQLINGMKVIKATSNILVEGVHRCENEIFHCSPLVAAELVSQGLAAFFTKPAEPAVETAAAAPVAETAARRPAKPSRVAAAKE